MLASVKYSDNGYNRRIAYFEFTQLVDFIVELDDGYYNISRINNEQTIIYEYTKLIKNRNCKPFPQVTSSIDLSVAIGETLYHFDEKYIADKHKKIVLINNCNSDDIDDACNVLHDVKGDSIEVIVVNIGSDDVDDIYTYEECFVDDNNDINKFFFFSVFFFLCFYSFVFYLCFICVMKLLVCKVRFYENLCLQAYASGRTNSENTEKEH